MKFTFTHKHDSGTQTNTYDTATEAFFAAGKHFGKEYAKSVIVASDYPTVWSDATIVLFHHINQDCFLYALASIRPIQCNIDINELCK